MAGLSNKKKRELSSDADGIMLKVLEEYSLRYSSDRWWDDPPENWSDLEKLQWDSLNELKDKLLDKFINLGNKPPTP